MDRAEANRISSKKYRMAHLDECRSKARDWYHRTKEQRKAYTWLIARHRLADMVI